MILLRSAFFCKTCLHICAANDSPVVSKFEPQSCVTVVCCFIVSCSIRIIIVSKLTPQDPEDLSEPTVWCCLDVWDPSAIVITCSSSERWVIKGWLQKVRGGGADRAQVYCISRFPSTDCFSSLDRKSVYILYTCNKLKFKEIYFIINYWACCCILKEHSQGFQ